ncbi:MAG: hypothetical protein HRU07_05170 [Nitrosopumilus sp.]|nr:hypothetical protein [Nitrosopumilus sp.]NRA05539.1 hypothetical protein [Nitrosopumilus sp.]
MSIPIRKGYAVKSHDQEKVSEIKFLELNKFITTSNRKLVTCNRCSSINLITSNNIENYLICKKCRKKISIHKTETDIQISSVNYKKIINHLNNLIESLEVPSNFDKYRNCWTVEINSKIIPVLIPDISSSNSILTQTEKEGTLYVMLDREKISPNINSINKSQFIEFYEILHSSDQLKEKIKEVSEKFLQNTSIKIECKLDKLLFNLDPYQFEEFCTVFLNSIKEKQDKLVSFYRYLSNKKSTLINSKIIPLGGPSNPDFYIIDLLDYLESAIQPGQFGEIKRYIKTTRFTFEDFSKAVMH